MSILVLELFMHNTCNDLHVICTNVFIIDTEICFIFYSHNKLSLFSDVKRHALIKEVI